MPAVPPYLIEPIWEQRLASSVSVRQTRASAASPSHFRRAVLIGGRRRDAAIGDEGSATTRSWLHFLYSPTLWTTRSGHLRRKGRGAIASSPQARVFSRRFFDCS